MIVGPIAVYTKVKIPVNLIYGEDPSQFFLSLFWCIADKGISLGIPFAGYQ